MYSLPFDDNSIDLAVLHMVLHYSDNPLDVLREASRVLRPDGRLIVVDFAAHGVEKLRSECQHHRLGFTDDEMRQFFIAAGFGQKFEIEQLIGDPLTVKFWHEQLQDKLRLVPAAEAN